MDRAVFMLDYILPFLAMAKLKQASLCSFGLSFQIKTFEVPTPGTFQHRHYPSCNQDNLR